MRYFLHFIWITNFITNINQLIMILLQCKPMAKFWDFTIKGTCDFRPTTSKVGFFQGGMSNNSPELREAGADLLLAWGAASDLALAIYP
jgi:hypothetical protein